MTELENIKLFFTNSVVKNSVSISKIEELARIPNRSLYFFLIGKKYRYLSPGQIDKLIPIIVQIGYKPLHLEDNFL